MMIFKQTETRTVYNLGKPCCKDMEEALRESVFDLSDGTMIASETQTKINFCPFCGQAIELAG